MENQNSEYPLRWGGIEPSENLKRLFKTDTKLAEAKVFELNEINKAFIEQCIASRDNNNTI